MFYQGLKTILNIIIIITSGFNEYQQTTKSFGYFTQRSRLISSLNLILNGHQFFGRFLLHINYPFLGSFHMV